jgi:chemotaxis protein histidine kinase CheA
MLPEPHLDASANPSASGAREPLVFALESHLDVELLREFRTEALQQLELAEIGVMALAGRPQDTELIAAVFRAFHTIKGMACFAGIPCIIEMAHNIETYLDPFRRGGKLIERQDTELVLAATEILKTLVNQIKDALTTRQLVVSPDYELVQQHLQHADLRSSAPRTATADARPLPQTPDQLADRAQTVYVQSVFQRMERLAAELARQERKEIVVVLDCADIKVNAQTSQLISEALLHLLRNALAHGIETSKERFACGKPLTGRLQLSARREENGVTISFRDDGRGINPQMVRARAIELNLLPADATLDDGALLQLIFLPLFTMSPKPTELRGRGMGLDIVCKNVKKLGGNVEVRSSQSEGTEFILTIPLH